MFFNKFTRLGLSVATIAGALSVVSLAAADSGKGQCDGKHGDKAAKFQRADKNADGFLTRDEVGDKRWQRIQVADTNKDQKVSKAELEQAHKDGKLGHPHAPRS
jgi:EF hand